MKRLLPVFALMLIVTAVACSQTGSAPSAPSAPALSTTDVKPSGVGTGRGRGQGEGQATPLSATIEFGRDSLGSPFPPPSGHDQSGHSRDSLFPSNVVIDKGGTVTFKMGASGVHEAAIYAPGVTPGDIDTSLLKSPAAKCPPVPVINDPTGRIAVLAQVCAGGSPNPTWTFDTPGKYLVVCTFLPHFNLRMWGWVTVRDR